MKDDPTCEKEQKLAEEKGFGFFPSFDSSGGDLRQDTSIIGKIDKLADVSFSMQQRGLCLSGVF